MFNRRRARFQGSTVTVRAEGLGKEYRKRPALGLHDTRQQGDHFWALRDVSFELRQGDILGIIGRNGSGKSTLLKMLSGITVPSEGRAELRGRVGSLLEVGTGFHPDLTGRENVFLAGSLLGVARSEVAAQVDAIAAFAGIGPFFDVPVKRYSSGMYVRLAYAVSAQLRSDILILDEVLAVGDAEFQEQTRGHVQNLAGDGRTVLFVSHSMESVKRFCNKCLWLEDGRVKDYGEVGDTTDRYLESALGDGRALDLASAPAFVDLTHGKSFYPDRPHRVIRSIETRGPASVPTRVFATGDPMTVELGYEAAGEVGASAYFTVFFLWPNEERRLVVMSTHDNAVLNLSGSGIVSCHISELRLSPGLYSVMIDFGQVDFDQFRSIDCIVEATSIRVEERGWLGVPAGIYELGEFVQPSQWAVVG